MQPILLSDTDESDPAPSAVRAPRRPRPATASGDSHAGAVHTIDDDGPRAGVSDQGPPAASSPRWSVERERLESELASIADDVQLYETLLSELRAKAAHVEQQLAALAQQEQRYHESLQAPPDYTRDDFAWSPRMREALTTVFGLPRFRGHQAEIINATLSGRDTFVIAPTGFGKSLCFHMAAYLADGMTLVISPLVSLIRDQTMQLEALGIPAAALTGTTPPEETRVILASMAHASDLKMVYVTPEKLVKSKRLLGQLQKMYDGGRLSLVVIDEAHCASQSSFDFRPDYRKLAICKTQFPKTPLMALSATCPPHLMTSVMTILQLPEINLYSGTLLFTYPLRRNNLRYEVVARPEKEADALAHMIAWIKDRHANEQGIVYCMSRKDTETVERALREQGLRAAAYHAYREEDDKEQIHRAWRDNAIQIVVATIAFGMGIDAPHVRFVVHHTMAKTIEAYYQESGRAGRDGEPAECRLYFRPLDMSRLTSLVVSDIEELDAVYAMVRYALSLSTCRRALMEAYFGVPTLKHEPGAPHGGTAAGHHGARLAAAERVTWTRAQHATNGAGHAGGQAAGQACGNCDICSHHDAETVRHAADVTREAYTLLQVLRVRPNVTILALLDLAAELGDGFNSGGGRKQADYAAVQAALVTAPDRDLVDPGELVLPLAPRKKRRASQSPLTPVGAERLVVALVVAGLMKETFTLTAYGANAYLLITDRGLAWLRHRAPPFQLDLLPDVHGVGIADAAAYTSVAAATAAATSASNASRSRARPSESRAIQPAAKRAKRRAAPIILDDDDDDDDKDDHIDEEDIVSVDGASDDGAYADMS